MFPYGCTLLAAVQRRGSAKPPERRPHKRPREVPSSVAIGVLWCVAMSFGGTRYAATVVGLWVGSAN